jgi:hypothetical protein
MRGNCPWSLSHPDCHLRARTCRRSGTLNSGKPSSQKADIQRTPDTTSARPCFRRRDLPREPLTNSRALAPQESMAAAPSWLFSKKWRHRHMEAVKTPQLSPFAATLRGRLAMPQVVKVMTLHFSRAAHGGAWFSPPPARAHRVRPQEHRSNGAARARTRRAGASDQAESSGDAAPWWDSPGSKWGRCVRL